MFFGKLTLKLLFIGTVLDITKMILLPDLSLLLWVLLLMVADLITGLLRAKFTKEPITSEKARRTIIKFLQYFGCVGLVVVLINQHHENEKFVYLMQWCKDGLAILILYIECLSVFENLYAMDKKTALARYFIAPIYWVLSLAVRNNPINKAKEEQEKKANGG